MVGFDPDTEPRHVDEALRTLGAPVKQVYDHLPHSYLLDLGGDAETTVGGAERLLAHGAVRYAEPAIVNRFAAQRIDPLDEQFAQQWHLTPRSCCCRTSSRTPTRASARPGRRPRARAHVVVAVLDDGFDLTHPDLQGPGKIVAAIDYTDGDANPLPVGVGLPRHLLRGRGDRGGERQRRRRRRAALRVPARALPVQRARPAC